MIAETVIGRGDRAFEYWKKIAPAYLEEQSEVHRLEPYVYAQMIAGKDAVRHGEAKNSWLTGTAAWNFVAISQYLLGVRPDFDGLRVHPCIGERGRQVHGHAQVPRRRVPHQRQEQRPGRSAQADRRRQGDRRQPGALRQGRRDRHHRLRGLIRAETVVRPTEARRRSAAGSCLRSATASPPPSPGRRSSNRRDRGGEAGDRRPEARARR